ncbi:11210_t:CDS:1 [Diversispora eburnea]|uniref:11210_t:CDS:1 n=1 Tax=Diversispora eburnea TaxID=1213867 RepID=A0A9N9DR41_9GLOM|nr:11210_t:CDS:1 [Diversispora eburnea]
MPQPENTKITITSAIQQMRNMGRPLWANVEEVYVVEFAIAKLLCDHDEAAKIHENKDIESIKLTIEQSLAILGARVYLEISRVSQQASKLVSHHMRILRHVDDKRESLITTYPSEPILAEAASHVMSHPRILKQILDGVIYSVKNHIIVNAGEQGELVGRILCLMAFDKVIQSKSGLHYIWNKHSQSITVEEFLNAFIGEGNYEKINSVLNETFNGLMFRNSKIRFSHFAYTNTTPSREKLVNFFFRGAAVLCKRGQQIVDLIIPIAMVPDDDTEVQHSNMSFIGIQIKNRKKHKSSDWPVNIAKAIGICNNTPFPLPYLVVFMSLNEESRKIECHDTVTLRDTRNSYFRERIGYLNIYGHTKNEYACLSWVDDNAEIQLQQLLQTYVDPFEEESAALWEGNEPESAWVTKYQNIVKNMEPLRYEKCVFENMDTS